MMLIAHDSVEAHFVGPGILVMVLVVEYVGLFWVEVGVGEAEPPRVVSIKKLVVDVSVGLFREPVDFHLILGPGQLVNHGCLLTVSL